MKSSVTVALILGLFGCSGGDDTASDKKDSKPIDTGEPSTSLPEVWINEFMASNVSTLQDETGAYPDWIELYNSESTDADISGWWLTDDLTDVFKWQVPDGVVVPANGFLVIFADSDPEEGDLHASFNLRAEGGEDIGLFGPNILDNPVVDSIEGYEILIADVSLARVPDGGSSWERVADATPGASNN